MAISFWIFSSLFWLDFKNETRNLSGSYSSKIRGALEWWIFVSPSPQGVPTDLISLFGLRKQNFILPSRNWDFPKWMPDPSLPAEILLNLVCNPPPPRSLLRSYFPFLGSCMTHGPPFFAFGGSPVRDVPRPRDVTFVIVRITKYKWGLGWD